MNSPLPKMLFVQISDFSSLDVAVNLLFLTRTILYCGVCWRTNANDQNAPPYFKFRIKEGKGPVNFDKLKWGIENLEWKQFFYWCIGTNKRIMVPGGAIGY